MIAALLIGFLGSMHCVGMCGPLVLKMPFNNKNGVVYSRLLSYHLGKITTYAFLGLITGLLGDALRFFFVQQWISIAAGVILLIVFFGPKVLKRYSTPRFSTTWNNQVVLRMRKLLQPNNQQLMPIRIFSLGLVNGLLPCGLVYMAVFGAIATTNILASSLYMFIFGLGTIPLMTAVVYLGNFTKGNFRRSIQKAIPIVVVFIGVLFVLRGLGLGIPYVSPLPINEVTSTLEGCH